jgi:hypothetical protein
MNMKLGLILRAQVALGRTSAGLPIDLKVMERAILATNAQNSKFLKCQGCKLILTENDFAAGCPNCTTKDVENVLSDEDVQDVPPDIRKVINDNFWDLVQDGKNKAVK